MIDLYSWPTPNGHKIHIMLEECELAYQVHPIDIGAGEQFSREFLAISPNNKIPAIIDHNGPDGQAISLFESGAILVYLAEKTSRLFGNNSTERHQIMQWLMFQMGGFGPMLGQAHHFRIYAPERIDYAYDRYSNEAKRLYAVIDKQLASHAYLAGEHYSIADIACFPWARSAANQGIDWSDFPHAKRWFDEIAARPAVQRGVQVLADLRKPLDNPQARTALFGAQQYQAR